jgi:hypothetical protein
MASKGPRRRVTARIPDEVHAILEDRRRRSGTATSLSQMISDVLALYVDRPDLAVELAEWEKQK